MGYNLCPIIPQPRREVVYHLEAQISLLRMRLLPPPLVLVVAIGLLKDVEVITGRVEGATPRTLRTFVERVIYLSTRPTAKGDAACAIFIQITNA